MEENTDGGEEQFDEKARERQIAQLKIFMDYLTKNYEPVEKISDSTLQLTTSEFYSKLQDLCPSPFYFEHNIFDLLFELGFKFHESGDLTFHWLFKQK